MTEAARPPGQRTARGRLLRRVGRRTPSVRMARIRRLANSISRRRSPRYGFGRLRGARYARKSMCAGAFAFVQDVFARKVFERWLKARLAKNNKRSFPQKVMKAELCFRTKA